MGAIAWPQVVASTRLSFRTDVGSKYYSRSRVRAQAGCWLACATLRKTPAGGFCCGRERRCRSGLPRTLNGGRLTNRVAEGGVSDGGPLHGCDRHVGFYFRSFNKSLARTMSPVTMPSETPHQSLVRIRGRCVQIDIVDDSLPLLDRERFQDRTGWTFPRRSKIVSSVFNSLAGFRPAAVSTG